MSETNTDSVMDTYKEYPIGDVFAELISEQEIKRKYDQPYTEDTYPEAEFLTKKYICDVCGANFIYETNLDFHRKSLHSLQKIFACSFCEKKFDSKTSLDSHLLIHSDLKPFVCNDCHKAFMMPSLLDAHMKTHNVGKSYRLPAEYICDECSMKFQSKKGLRIHTYQVHKPKKEEEILSLCDSCHKTYGNNQILERHRAVYSEIKTYSCGMCRKRFQY